MRGTRELSPVITAGACSPLPYEAWQDTLYALHRWTQILGKMRFASTPLLNHSWNSTLQVTARGLTTGLIPSGDDAFQIDLDLVGDEFRIETSRGARALMSLGSVSVAQFYRELLGLLATVDVPAPRIGGHGTRKCRKGGHREESGRDAALLTDRSVGPSTVGALEVLTPDEPNEPTVRRRHQGCVVMPTIHVLEHLDRVDVRPGRYP